MALIEREAAQRRFENYRMDCEEAGDAVAAQVFADCITELEDVPTIDAAPVVHGRWVEYLPVLGAGDLQIRCSECGLTHDVRTSYCPNCGARMDGGDGDG